MLALKRLPEKHTLIKLAAQKLQTNGRTHTHTRTDATKRIISPATRSINIVLHFDGRVCLVDNGQCCCSGDVHCIHLHDGRPQQTSARLRT